MANELLVSEMQIKINREHRLRFEDMISESARFIFWEIGPRHTTSAAVGAKILWANHWKQAYIVEVHLGRSIKQIYSTFEVPWGKTNLK